MTIPEFGLSNNKTATVWSGCGHYQPTADK